MPNIDVLVNTQKPKIDIGVSVRRPDIHIGMPSGGGAISASINGVKLKGPLTYLDLFLVKGNVNTKAHWESNPLYVPEIGEVVIYIDRQTIEGVDYPGIKIGDGNAYLADLPFLGDDITTQIMDALSDHINNTDIHVTTEEKNFWNNKLNCEVSSETLVLNKQ